MSVLAQTAQASALFSVALIDTVCPSTVFAAYNAYAGPKTMQTYPTTTTMADSSKKKQPNSRGRTRRSAASHLRNLKSMT